MVTYWYFIALLGQFFVVTVTKKNNFDIKGSKIHVSVIKCLSETGREQLPFVSTIRNGFVQSECPFGWIHYEEGCYLFSTEQLDWFTAQSSCRAHDARLAEVDTKALADHLISFATILNRHLGYWLGGRDDALDGTWVWSSSDQLFTYTDWALGEPNGHALENCLEMRYALNWLWNDEACSSHLLYVCQKKLPGSGEIVG